MSSGQEDFEQLRKLLKLKQHEQPPPGYFNNFSGLVISRIEKESGAAGAWLEVPWLQKLWRLLESSPVFSGIFGAAVCGLVIFGIALANQPDKPPPSAFAPVNGSAADVNARDMAFNADHPEMLSHSTDPLFGSNLTAVPFTADNGAAHTEPVSFSTAPR
jgi:hypothetical protein